MMVTAQLFSFERFPAVIEDMWLPGVSDNATRVLAAVIVAMEVLALPFLLRLHLSPAMRVLSMVLGWLVVAGWVVVLVWQNVSINVLANNGLLGDTIALPVGWWSVCLLLGLGVAAAWASWGMWPLSRDKQ